ncbi:unnamed protein product, partial [Phaeothamnion confervicola]
MVWAVAIWRPKCDYLWPIEGWTRGWTRLALQYAASLFRLPAFCLFPYLPFRRPSRQTSFSVSLFSFSLLLLPLQVFRVITATYSYGDPADLAGLHDTPWTLL